MSTRVGLVYILQQFVEQKMIENCVEEKYAWAALIRELMRVSKTGYEAPNLESSNGELFFSKLQNLRWNDVYVLIERIYARLLTDQKDWTYDGNTSYTVVELSEVRSSFTKEINNLLSEEAIPYTFEDGLFQRPGRPQTQKNLNRAFAILSRPELKKVRSQFTKAFNFYSSLDKPDYGNSIKESLCSLELAAEILSGEKISKDFSREILRFSGTGDDKIPSALIGAMIKLFAYRGTAEGAVHGIDVAQRAEKSEAELIMSTTAAFITYLVEFFDSQGKGEIEF